MRSHVYSVVIFARDKATLDQNVTTNLHKHDQYCCCFSLNYAHQNDLFFTLPVGCGEGKFSCLNGNCVSPEFVCNSENDCGDYSDERHCSKSIARFSCKSQTGTRDRVVRA